MVDFKDPESAIDGLEELLALLEKAETPDAATRITKATSSLFSLVADLKGMPPSGHIPRKPPSGGDTTWRGALRTFCDQAKLRLKEQENEQQTRAALHRADVLIKWLQHLAKKGKTVSHHDPLTDLTETVDLDDLYEPSTKCDERAPALYFKSIHARAESTVCEIERFRPRSGKEQWLLTSLAYLARNPDSYRKTEAQQKLAVLTRALECHKR